MPNPSAASSPTPSGFAYSRDQFRAFVDSCLATAKSLGASDAVAEVSEGVGLSVSVRKGETENIERNRDKSISVTVYVGQRRGNASTSDFSRGGARADGARGARHRPLHRRGSGGRPARRRRPRRRGARPGATSTSSIPGRSTPRRRSSSPAAARRRRSPSIARITNSEGAGVSAQQSHFYAGNTRGFGAGYASSRHSLSVAPIASLPGKNGDDMQRDAWYTLDARRPTSSPRRRRSAATPPSARSRAWRRARSRPARCRCCSNRRSPRGCSAPTCRRRAAARCTASRPSCSTASASASCPSTSTSARTRTCRAARAARRSTTKASRRGRRRSSTPASSAATSCRPTRRASSACARPATPAARTT